MPISPTRHHNPVCGWVVHHPLCCVGLPVCVTYRASAWQSASVWCLKRLLRVYTRPCGSCDQLPSQAKRLLLASVLPSGSHVTFVCLVEGLYTWCWYTACGSNARPSDTELLRAFTRDTQTECLLFPLISTYCNAMAINQAMVFIHRYSLSVWNECPERKYTLWFLLMWASHKPADQY